MRATVSSSSSRSMRNVACSDSAGPNSSSSRCSHSAPSAARAASANGDGGCSSPRSERAAIREHQPRSRPRHRQREQAPHLGHVGVARVGRQRLVQQLIRDRRRSAPARARHPRRLQAEDVDVLELQALGVVHGHHAHPAAPRRRRSPPPRAARPRRPRRCSARTPAAWPGARAARRPRPSRRTWRG